MPSTARRAVRSLLLVFASLGLTASAHAGIDAALREADRIGETDPARALALFERLALDAGARQDAAALQAIRRRSCWLLGVTAPEKALALVREAGAADPGLQVCRGYAYEQLNRQDEALADYESGVEAGRRLGDDTVLARALALRGEQRYLRGLYGGAIEDLKASYDLERKLGNDNNQRYVLNALANLYADRNVGEYDSALERYRELLLASEKANKRKAAATAHFNIASTSENKGDLAQAREHFALALKIDKELGVAGDIATDQRAYAVVLSKTGEHAAALAMLDGALRIASGLPQSDPGLVAAIRLSRGGALRRAGRHTQALADLQAAQQHFETERNDRFLQKIYEEQARTHEALGNWKAAYAAQARMMAVQAALHKRMLDERTTRLRVQFESEQARLRNAGLQYQNAVQRIELDKGRSIRRWQLAALAASAAAIVVLCILGLRQRRIGLRMRDLAMTDELTRLPNRRSLMALAAEAFAGARKEGGALSVAALDIDYFKRINDRYGHALGDVVLQRVGHALRGALRPGDAVGRTGGEEFIVVLRGAGELDALRAAERLREAVERIDCGDLPAGLVVRISVGVAQLGAEGDTLDALLVRADEALYRAKERGRNRVELSAA
ncbi:GGDEF domain-containing protein [Massilia sp. DD77]|uniref:GGDEF domain-containing protein n=1 Tax=Massilia sp. DD77 TaxID=3109349 RepID=UPI002FFEBCF1